jgi:hypothetical protein
MVLEEEEEEEEKKKRSRKKKNSLFSSSRHRYKVCGCGSLCNVIADVIVVHCCCRHNYRLS